MRIRDKLISTKVLAVCGLAAIAGCGTCKKETAEAEDTMPVFITGKIADSAKYESLHPRFAKAFAFMRRADLAKLKPGRYEIDGDNMWAMIQESKLTPFGDVQRTEVHGKYIDIQAPLDGPETIGPRLTSTRPRTTRSSTARRAHTPSSPETSACSCRRTARTRPASRSTAPRA